MKASWLVLVFTLVGCGSSSGGDSSGGGANEKAERVVWSEVSADHHPEVNKTSLALSGLDTLKVNIFGSGGDFSVIYDPKMPAGQGQLNVYRVWKESSSFGGIVTRVDGTTLSATSNGSYECSIRVENGRITQLKGGCVVRLEVVLPVGSEVEVYDAGQLKTRRYKAMTNAELLANMRGAYTDDNRFAVIETYLASYREVGRRPALLAPELGRVLHDFSFTAKKMEALRKLNAFVADRESLRPMIESEFTYFERADARAAVGLP